LSAVASDDRDFADLVELHRAELHAHCYRMLGSVHDADDALQETLLRAWRGAAGLRDSRAARSWLYSIATNVCLTELERRRKRVLPHDFGPAAEAHTPPGAPASEFTWLEPYPDESLPAARAAPEATYEQREGVELAFVAALQHLGANQRAVLLLREVLGFSAQESATMLQTTVASVNSALQRARAAAAERVPERTQQATLRSLGDRGLRDLVDRYLSAWERCDVDAFASLLVKDATFAMPPLTTWYTPRDTIITWARRSSMSGAWRWRAVQTSANAQPALAFYAWDDPAGAFLPFALNVLSLRDSLVSDVTAFIVRSTEAPDPEAYARFPDQPMDPSRLAGTFERFGMPDRLIATAPSRAERRSKSGPAR
jgi:RNA polymerase sigma-70 factor, ECF subfamily